MHTSRDLANGYADFSKRPFIEIVSSRVKKLAIMPICNKNLVEGRSVIPPNITREHILQAIQEIDQYGVPSGRESTKYQLIFNGRFYPPKYVISLANKFANRGILDAQTFSGGKEANGFLSQRGFQIKQWCGPVDPPPPPPRHNERCLECKQTVKNMLEAIYGEAKTNYQVPISTRLEDYKQFPFYSHLHTIFTALQQHRGHQNFVRTPTLPPCDFFVPTPGFIVEFDESQHFTQPRALTLRHYSSELRLGFPLPKWHSLCQRLHARDNDPPFRDEQRAWYDTLRDFLPEVKGFQPTIRLYATERQWCSLNPESPEDRKRFKEIIEQKHLQSRAWIATVVLQSNGHYSNEGRLQLLTHVLQEIITNTDGDGMIIFPAGWFQAGSHEARTLYPWIEEQVTPLLRRDPRQLLICLGVDGRKDVCTRDQIGLVLSSAGIIAIGRKFYPTARERGKIDLANDPWAPEDQKSRVFTLHGRNYYLAVCYDSFGIRKEAVAARNIDAVIDLVHGFHPKGQGESGDVYFAKHGFAGASKQWKCPVFGTAVFFNRDNIENWPSAVSWNQGEKSTQLWQYNDNPLSPRTVQPVAAKEGKVTVRVYDLCEKEPPKDEEDILCDKRCEEIVRMCQEQHLPLPEVGYELMDASGGVCAQAELVWPERKIAILLPEQTDFEARFLEQNWAVFSVALVVDDPSSLQRLLTENQSQGFFSALLKYLSRVVPFSLLWGKES